MGTPKFCNKQVCTYKTLLRSSSPLARCVCNAQGDGVSRALEGRYVTSKIPSRVQEGDGLGGTKENSISRQLNDFSSVWTP